MLKLLGLAVLAFGLAANASQLDLAIVQFPEVKTAGELEAALARVDLAGITNSDRVMTKESYLKGGYVVFAQSLSAGESFSSSTRISNSRADVQGQLARGKISVKITLSEGVQAGLRRFSSRTYEANSPLAPGQTRVLGIRQISAKTTVAIRGQASVSESNYCSVIIGRVSK
ncbi:MAG: hypothetical protein WCG76_05430 [Verrucomicrobiota bacterium]